MKGMKDLLAGLRAGYCFFYCQTLEMTETVREIYEGLKEFEFAGEKPYFPCMVWDMEKNPDPEAALEELAGAEYKTVMLAKNFHWFLADEMGALNKQVVQWLQNRVDLFSSSEDRKSLVILGDAPMRDAIPSVLQRDFIEVEFPLPDNGEIENLFEYIVESAKESEKFVMPDDNEREKVLDYSRGMTKREIVNAYSYALIKDEGKLLPKTIGEIQAREVAKTPGLRILEGKLTFDSLKGYSTIKLFTKSTIGNPLSKGIMLLGPPGTGKTHFSTCLAAESGLKMITLEMAELFGGLVGESEKLMKRALDVIAANAPCIVLVDEIEKGLAGVGGSGSTDGGTTKRSMAQFLKFLSDSRPEGVYVVATCNNISQLPPEWVRAERWDTAPFFIDLPNEEEREEIYSYYLEQYKVKSGKLSAADMDGWSGAEIKAICRIAAMMGKTCDEVKSFVVPVSKTMEAEITNLREWSKGKTLPASEFKMVEPIKKRTKRAMEI